MPELAETEPRDGTTAEHPALAAYRLRTRRASRIYAAILVVLVVIAVVAVKVAYAHGELNKVSFTTAPSPPAISGVTPAPALRLAWHTGDTAAGGTPYQDGIVVTYQGHTVNGRDAVTGAVRWHYTRSDETLCSVLQQDSSTIAIYRRKGNCDEVTGFVTATGEPKFYRTLTDDGTTQATSLPNVVMTVGPHFVHEFDNAGGLDRWDWTAPAGCTVSRALAGGLGTLISLDCGAAHQLVLRDLIQDSTHWTITTPTAMVPITAAAFIGAVDTATGEVYRYSTDKGKATVVSRLTGVPATGWPLVQASVATTDARQNQIEFVSLGQLVTFSNDGSIRWRRPGTGRPSIVADAFLAAISAPGRVVLYRVDQGQVQLTSAVSPNPPAADSAVFPVGAGLLFAGAGVSVYR